jgi:hypothetical protein
LEIDCHPKGRLPRNLWAFPESFGEGAGCPKLCNIGGILSQLLSNADPFPTFLWMYCLVHPNLKDCTKKLYLDEVLKESSLVVGCKMTKMWMGWTSMLVPSLHY